MSHRSLGLLGAALVIVGLLAIGGGTIAGGPGAAWPAWMGSWFGGPAGSVGSRVPSAREGALESAVPTGASVDRSTNTLGFDGGQIELTVLAAPPDGPDETFRIAGMTNPTIVVPEGARITLRLVNADEDMPHNFLLTGALPPFPVMGMMMAAPVFGAYTPTLGEASSDGMPSATVTFTASRAGRYTYLCSVPGHAAKGMHGAFVVTGAS